MAKPKQKPQYREGTLGWWLMEAGWTPVEQKHGHPLWQFGEFGELLTGEEARRRELSQIDEELKAKARLAKI